MSQVSNHFSCVVELLTLRNTKKLSLMTITDTLCCAFTIGCSLETTHLLFHNA